MKNCPHLPHPSPHHPYHIHLVYKEVIMLTAGQMASRSYLSEEDLTNIQITIEDPEGTPYLEAHWA